VSFRLSRAFNRVLAWHLIDLQRSTALPALKATNRPPAGFLICVPLLSLYDPCGMGLIPNDMAPSVPGRWGYVRLGLSGCLRDLRSDRPAPDHIHDKGAQPFGLNGCNLEGTFLAQFSIDMVLVSQQQQNPARDEESEPLLQKDLHATPTPRLSLFKRVLKVGGVLVAIDLLVCTLFISLTLTGSASTVTRLPTATRFTPFHAQ